MHSRLGVPNASAISAACSHLLFGARQSAPCFCFEIRWGSSHCTIGCPPSGGIVFASELKALLAFPGFQPSLDRRAIGQFLEFGYTFEDDRTILNGVHKLPPGHFLRVRAKRETEARALLPPERRE